MANWAFTSYAIEGPEEALLKIEHAILNPIDEGDDGWEGAVLKALGLTWEERQSDGTGKYMRGFIDDKPWWDDGVLRFNAQEAWGATDFNEVLEENIPNIKVYYSVEEEDGEVYATNDAEGKYFPERYWVDACINSCYQSEYFPNKEQALDYINRISSGEVTTFEEAEAFSNKEGKYENTDPDDYISVHEFTVIT